MKPVSYSIPYDGPVGAMLTLLGRHPYRPAHMHFMVTAPGYQKIVTHTFAGDDPYIGSNAAFGVKDELVAPYGCEETGERIPMWRTTYDIVMVPQETV